MVPFAVKAVELAYGIVDAAVLVEVMVPPTKRLLEMYPPPWTESGEPGVVVPSPTLPLPSITNLSLVPMTEELETLNLPPSFKSVPTAQLFRKLPAPEMVLEAENTS